MAVELPVKVLTQIKAEAMSANTLLSVEARGNIQNTNNILRAVATRMVDEPSPQTAMAVAKVLALP